MKLIIKISVTLVIFLSALALLLPLLVQTGYLRHNLTQLAAQSIGADIHYQQLQLHWWPKPYVTISAGSYAAGTIKASWGKLSLFPTLGALLTGHANLAQIIIEQPEISLTLPPAAPPSSSAPRAQQFRQLLLQGLRAPFPLLAETRITLKDGRFHLLDSQGDQSRPRASWHEINGHLRSGPQDITLDLSCRAGFATQTRLQLTLARSLSQLTGELACQGVSPETLLAIYPTASPLKVKDGPVDLAVRFSAVNMESCHLEFTASSRALTLSRGKRAARLRDLALQGGLDLSPTRLRLRLDQLKMADPQLTLAAKLDCATTAPRDIRLRITAHQATVESVRKAALALGSDSAILARVFEILRGGQAAPLQAWVQGDTWSDLAHFTRWHLRGQLTKGALLAPVVEMELSDLAGEVTIDKGILAVRKGRASYGATRGNRGELDLDLTGKSHIFRLDLDLAAELGQLPPILERVITQQSFRAELARIHNLHGRARGKLHLQNRPAGFEVHVLAKKFDLEGSYDRLPHPLTLHGGFFTLAGKTIRFSGAEAWLHDAHLQQLSGQVEWRDKISLSVRTGAGEAGTGMVAWLRQILAVPAQYRLPPPLTARNFQVDWEQRGMTRLAGEIRTGRGTKLTTEVRLAAAEIAIPQLVVEDAATTAHFTLTHHRATEVSALTFQGTLAGSTLDQFWENNHFLKGYIRGELRAAGAASQFLGADFSGKLEVGQLNLSLPASGPLQITHALLSGADHKVEISEATVNWLENELAVAGHAICKPENIFFKLNSTAQAIDLNLMDQFFRSKKAREQSGASATPVRYLGVIAMEAEKIKFSNYTWEGCSGTMVADNTTMTITIERANLCGIATPGVITVSPRGVQLELTPHARPEEMEYTIGCLTAKPTTEQLKGRLKLNGTLATEGRSGEELLANLTGELDLAISDGLIYNMGSVGTFTNLFSFLKIHKVLTGELPDLTSNDFRYRLFSTKLLVKEGKVELAEGFVDGENIDIVATEGEVDLRTKEVNANLLICPLKPLDIIIKYTPILGHILHGTLIAIPIKVQGDIMNPGISALSASAYGSRALDIVKRTLQMPIKIIEPILQ